jgi:protein tyrosine/serine phosphatase
VGAVNGRVLRWDGLVNARDLGGLPLRRGGATRFGSLIRSDNVRHLTAAGWSTLAEHGVRTIVDLRFELERDDARAGVPDDFVVVNVSLLGPQDSAEASRVNALIRAAPDAASGITAFYLDILESRGSQVAAAIAAVADASDDGAVLVHCFVGKDRTGIIAALLLELAGVEPAAIVADYALSATRVGPLVDDWIEAASDPDERAYRSRISGAPSAAMEGMLQGLRDRYGGTAGYLRGVGVREEAVLKIRTSLAPRLP